MSADRIEQGKAVRWIVPGWLSSANVFAATTLRTGGVSTAPYESFNLGDHVGDVPAAVETNRQWLQQQLQLPSPPRWLSQVHGVACVDAVEVNDGCEADASFTTQPGVVCAVLTADCLPVLLSAADGSVVAAVHAGWRGLADGVIESTIAAMGGGHALMAWLGPAIGPHRFEVGPEVRETFVERDAEAVTAFVAGEGDRWWADLYVLARLVLEKHGVKSISGGEWCTASDAEKFYSYRRDGITGRMATLIWIAA